MGRCPDEGQQVAGPRRGIDHRDQKGRACQPFGQRQLGIQRLQQDLWQAFRCCDFQRAFFDGLRQIRESFVQPIHRFGRHHDGPVTRIQIDAQAVTRPGNHLGNGPPGQCRIGRDCARKTRQPILAVKSHQQFRVTSVKNHRFNHFAFGLCL